MPGIRAQRPLRMAEIKVDDVPGRPGWYAVGLKVRPHFKYMGASFTLSLVGQQGPRQVVPVHASGAFRRWVAGPFPVVCKGPSGPIDKENASWHYKHI